MKVTGSRSRSHKQKARNSLFLECKILIGSKSTSIDDKAVKSACMQHGVFGFGVWKGATARCHVTGNTRTRGRSALDRRQSSVVMRRRSLTHLPQNASAVLRRENAGFFRDSRNSYFQPSLSMLTSFQSSGGLHGQSAIFVGNLVCMPLGIVNKTYSHLMPASEMPTAAAAENYADRRRPTVKF